MPTEESPSAPRKPLSLQLKAGLAITGAIVLLGLLAPWIAPHPWDTISMRTRFLSPSATYWFGTDEYGRDVLSRLLMGTRLSLAMGLSATAISLAIGVPIGLLAGYLRGWVDEVLMRGADVLMAVTPGAAAKARAESTTYILFREILPNAWPPLIVEASLRITYAILLGSALSFLGLGAQPPSSDWGLMISEARSFLDRAPWIALAPGLAMCLLVIGINLLGDGARERLDPRLKSRVGKA